MDSTTQTSTSSSSTTDSSETTSLSTDSSETMIDELSTTSSSSHIDSSDTSMSDISTSSSSSSSTSSSSSSGELIAPGSLTPAMLNAVQAAQKQVNHWRTRNKELIVLFYYTTLAVYDVWLQTIPYDTRNEAPTLRTTPAWIDALKLLKLDAKSYSTRTNQAMRLLWLLGKEVYKNFWIKKEDDNQEKSDVEKSVFRSIDSAYECMIIINKKYEHYIPFDSIQLPHVINYIASIKEQKMIDEKTFKPIPRPRLSKEDIKLAAMVQTAKDSVTDAAITDAAARDLRAKAVIDYKAEKIVGEAGKEKKTTKRKKKSSTSTSIAIKDENEEEGEEEEETRTKMERMEIQGEEEIEEQEEETLFFVAFKSADEQDDEIKKEKKRDRKKEIPPSATQPLTSSQESARLDPYFLSLNTSDKKARKKSKTIPIFNVETVKARYGGVVQYVIGRKSLELLKEYENQKTNHLSSLPEWIKKTSLKATPNCIIKQSLIENAGQGLFYKQGTKLEKGDTIAPCYGAFLYHNDLAQIPLFKDLYTIIVVGEALATFIESNQAARSGDVVFVVFNFCAPFYVNNAFGTCYQANSEFHEAEYFNDPDEYYTLTSLNNIYARNNIFEIFASYGENYHPLHTFDQPAIVTTPLSSSISTSSSSYTHHQQTTPVPFAASDLSLFSSSSSSSSHLSTSPTPLKIKRTTKSETNIGSKVINILLVGCYENTKENSMNIDQSSSSTLLEMIKWYNKKKDTLHDKLQNVLTSLDTNTNNWLLSMDAIIVLQFIMMYETTIQYNCISDSTFQQLMLENKNDFNSYTSIFLLNPLSSKQSDIITFSSLPVIYQSPIEIDPLTYINTKDQLPYVIIPLSELTMVKVIANLTKLRHFAKQQSIKWNEQEVRIQLSIDDGINNNEYIKVAKPIDLSKKIFHSCMVQKAIKSNLATCSVIVFAYFSSYSSIYRLYYYPPTLHANTSNNVSSTPDIVTVGIRKDEDNESTRIFYNLSHNTHCITLETHEHSLILKEQYNIYKEVIEQNLTSYFYSFPTLSLYIKKNSMLQLDMICHIDKDGYSLPYLININSIFKLDMIENIDLSSFECCSNLIKSYVRSIHECMKNKISARFITNNNSTSSSSLSSIKAVTTGPTATTTAVNTSSSTHNNKIASPINVIVVKPLISTTTTTTATTTTTNAAKAAANILISNASNTSINAIGAATTATSSSANVTATTSSSAVKASSVTINNNQKAIGSTAATSSLNATATKITSPNATSSSATTSSSAIKVSSVTINNNQKAIGSTAATSSSSLMKNPPSPSSFQSGLVNPSQTCYALSIIQSFRSFPTIVNRIKAIADQLRTIKNASFPIHDAFSQIFTLLNMSPSLGVNKIMIENFVKLIKINKNKNEYFSPKQQSCAAEFCLQLLDQLHVESQQGKIPSVNSLFTASYIKTIKSERYATSTNIQNETIIDLNFDAKKSLSKTLTMDAAIDLMIKDESTLEDYTIDTKDLINNPKVRANLTRDMIDPPPEILQVNNVQAHSENVPRIIDFYTFTLKLKNNIYTYRLRSCISHAGEKSSGHYRTHAFDAKTGKWYFIDDNKATLIDNIVTNLNNIHNESIVVYIYFYELIK